ncbi:uncharacterized protein LOC105217019 [Zeugodacus cucurbitae]|uniref:uncharacterized protein LOC105217019 n=1 Tax=Zeugodacus cucurbitae TaxID=28588 RepID=UPI0023D945B7|nr:uncharacterized protein LOC105217019 [Zeugodacus cucurbitae]
MCVSSTCEDSYNMERIKNISIIMDNSNDDEILVPVWNDEMALLGILANDSATLEYEITPVYEEFWQILQNMLLIIESIMPVIFFIAIARIMGQKTMHTIPADTVLRYLLEVVIIISPTVLFVIILHKYIYAVNIVFAISMIFALFKIYKTKAQKRWYITGGRRPFVLTLVRVTIYVITSVCILSEDFEFFPSVFELTYGFGVGLKDALVGFYVFSMASVERNKNKWHGVRRTVIPLLLMALVRLVSITYFRYIQDENEYGIHWNVFVTLAVTKCVGTLYCYLFNSRMHQLISGVALVILHQLALRVYFTKMIMNPHYPRDNLFSANREGFLSLSGFIGLYLISVYIGRCLRKQLLILSYAHIIHKIKIVGLTALALWMLTISCAFTVSISRVTCNLGYVVWILAMSLTFTFVFMVVFHLVINTLWFIDENYTYSEIYYGSILHAADIPSYRDTLPVLVEAINKNGFLFFILTIFMARLNAFADPPGQDRKYAFLIIFNAMIFATGIVSLIHHFKFRIAF